MNKIILSVIMCMLLTTSVFALEIEEIKQLNFFEKIFSFFSIEQQVLGDKPKYIQGDLMTFTDGQNINANCNDLFAMFLLEDSSGATLYSTSKQFGKTGFTTIEYKVTQDSKILKEGWYDVKSIFYCKIPSAFTDGKGKYHILQSNGNLGTDDKFTSQTTFKIILPTKYSCSNTKCIVDTNGKYTTSSCDNQCQLIPPPVECVTGQTKCFGSNFNVCSNGKWSDSGLVKGKCDVECTKNSHCSQTYDQRPYCKGDSVYAQIRTGVCENNECDSTSSEQLLQVCDNGCSNGECKNVPPPKCVEGTSQDCMVQGQIGTQTCVNNQWSQCVHSTCLEGSKETCVAPNQIQGERTCTDSKWSECKPTKIIPYWIGIVISLFVVFFFAMFGFILITKRK